MNKHNLTNFIAKTAIKRAAKVYQYFQRYKQNRKKTKY